MNILFLGYKNCKLFNFLNSLYDVTHTEEKINIDDCEDFDWVISFGYRHILKKDFISVDYWVQQLGYKFPWHFMPHRNNKKGVQQFC